MKKELAENAVIVDQRFDFKKNAVEVMDFETLKRTYLEIHPVTQQPLRGIHHHRLIETVMDICKRHYPDVEIKEIFAAQSQDKTMPGVIVAPHMIEKFGPGAPEAHCLRRVFTTIHLSTPDNEESDTGIAIAYHQDGIQIGMGPNIKICHNQCILSRERTVSTYGPNKVTEFDKIFQIIDDWMHNMHSIRKEDLELLERMKAIPMSYNQVAELIGQVTMIRVGHDAYIKRCENYPLNQGQISVFTQRFLTEYHERMKNGDNSRFSLFDVYNIATENFKADKMAIPSIINQNLAWSDIIKSEYIHD